MLEGMRHHLSKGGQDAACTRPAPQARRSGLWAATRSSDWHPRAGRRSGSIVQRQYCTTAVLYNGSGPALKTSQALTNAALAAARPPAHRPRYGGRPRLQTQAGLLSTTSLWTLPGVPPAPDAPAVVASPAGPLHRRWRYGAGAGIAVVQPLPCFSFVPERAAHAVCSRRRALCQLGRL